MQVDFVQALRDIGREKDIPLETLSEIIEAALVSAYKKHHGAACEIHVDIDWDDSTAAVFTRKQVVEHVENMHLEMSLAEARRLDPTVREGEYLDIEVSPAEFGRIAAQTAKQVVAQRIREAERDIIYSEFSSRDGDIVTGVVQRREGRTGTVFIDLGKVEAILPPSEQSPLDSYRFGDRIKVYVIEVKRTTKTPRVLVSRSHPGLLRRLFELEVPELQEGVVEIKAQAREAGARSKIAVWSRQENVDPVGACVGHRGARVQAVVDELRGEKVDIVRWSDEAAKYVMGALSPAKVSHVTIDEGTRAAMVIAPDNQLSLAIGREGQNVRLAARLTGWRIDIRSEAQIAQMEAAVLAQAEQAAQAAADLAAPEADLAEAAVEPGELAGISAEVDGVTEASVESDDVAEVSAESEGLAEAPVELGDVVEAAAGTDDVVEVAAETDDVVEAPAGLDEAPAVVEIDDEALSTVEEGGEQMEASPVEAPVLAATDDDEFVAPEASLAEVTEDASESLDSQES